LDHWIAREVLGMDENTWSLILEGGGADVSKLNLLNDRENRTGLVDRMRDVVVAREALFPETLGGGAATDDDEVARGELAGDLEQDETNKSIDALLASLGSFDDDLDTEWKFDQTESAREEEGAVEKEPIETIMDELQVWRTRNESSPYDQWDRDRKQEFDVSL
jgi:hypothetical protein